MPALSRLRPGCRWRATPRPTATWPCRHVSTAAGALRPHAKVQSYISRSRDPFLNLSIEHYLLQKSAPDSTILFLYTNRPCIVLGRNQNPWMEVNLGLLKAAQSSQRRETEPPAIGDVDLVRRRSGGGTVFHDEGNVNWSVICPPADFTRDKHAEMVVRALRKQGVARAKVNERHDIVLDQGSQAVDADENDTHRTRYTVDGALGPRPLKVSGSAYKLTRTRALHHGTCLLSTPNLHIIPHYLHSPAKPFITAQGVESVSSPVANIGIPNDRFIEGVREAFGAIYASADVGMNMVEVGEEQLETADIRKGYDEMKTLEWTYLQTPRFVFSTHPTEKEDGQRLAHLASLPASTQIRFEARNGVINKGSISALHKGHAENAGSGQEDPNFEGLRLHEVSDWTQVLSKMRHDGSIEANADIEAISKWLQSTLPSPLH